MCSDCFGPHAFPAQQTHRAKGLQLVAFPAQTARTCARAREALPVCDGTLTNTPAPTQLGKHNTHTHVRPPQGP